MHIIHVFGQAIPLYGFLIAIGVLLANVLGYFLLKSRKLDFLDFLILEAYALLGGWIGAKLLYIILARQEIVWSRFFELEYFNTIMRGGFVFYGGLIGGLLTVLLAGKIHKINISGYLNAAIVLLPFVHGMGRIGCFFAGCCSGIPYSGFGAVIYKEGALAPIGVPLFPVQLVEAGFLFSFAIVFLILYLRKRSENLFSLYLILYGILRFVLEFFRFHDNRGMILNLSTSQWISLLMIIAGIVIWVIKKRCKCRSED